MAIVFELWMECQSPAHAEQMVPHFDGLQHTLVTGRAVTWRAGVDYQNALAVEVEPVGLNRYGCATEEDNVEQTESELRLYHRLLTAPAFRYARAARCAYLRPLDDVLWEYSRDGGGETPDGFDLHCVLDEEVWDRLGRPTARLFRPGYWSTVTSEHWLKLLAGANYPELLGFYREMLSAEQAAPPDRGGD
jgi:hypothetical protein